MARRDVSAASFGEAARNSLFELILDGPMESDSLKELEHFMDHHPPTVVNTFMSTPNS